MNKIKRKITSVILAVLGLYSVFFITEFYLLEWWSAPTCISIVLLSFLNLAFCFGVFDNEEETRNNIFEKASKRMNENLK